ncbi:MAG TPA: demethoxyubiquinone hydroxylase family protein [Magnetospirillum sp.]|nr:demethoxyubiquinone hydroxylase family protein [Magnetospirillum sp.]
MSVPNETKDQRVARFLRVNQAGELGAVRIYQGQRAVLGKGRHGPLLAKMAAQEQHHLDTFDRLIGERQVRPTALSPLWHVAGFVLGAGTALLGERAAMACTVAVEEAIDEHYADQASALGEDEAELKATIEQFRVEELEHRDIGLANEAEKAPAYPLLSTAIKTGCKLAIWLSERV